MNLRLFTPFFLVLSVSADLSATSPLPSGKAPFRTAAENRKYDGEVLFDADKLVFTYGNKRLQFWKNGVFSVFSDNRELSKGFFMLATPFLYWQINENAALSSKGFDGSRMRVTSIKTEGKKVVFLGKVPWQTKGSSPVIAGDWRITAEAAGKGRIKVEWSYDIPAGMKRIEDGVFITVKQCREVDAGSAGRWIPGSPPSEKHIFSNKKTVLTQMGLQAADTYRIETPRCKTQGDRLRLRHCSNGRISAVFDFSGSPAAGKPVNKAGGIDLLAADALIVPERRGRNLLPNPYFADKAKFINFHSAYVPSKDLISTDAKFGRYSFARAGWTKFATVPADAGDYVFSFYAKGESRMSVYFTSAGRDFARVFPVEVNSPDCWTRYEIPFRFPVNNAITFELRLPTRILIDGMQLEKGKKATPFEAPAVEVSQSGNDFFDSGSEVSLEYELNTLLPRAAGKGTISIRNFFGETVWHKAFTYDVAAGKYPKLKVEPGRLPDGIYVINFNYGKTAPEQFFRFAVMPFLKNTHRTARIFALSYYSYFPLLTDYYEKELDRMRKIGIGIDGHSCLMTRQVLDLFAKYDVIPFDVGYFNRADSARMKKIFPGLKNIPPGRMWFYISDRLGAHAGTGRTGILPDYRLVGGWTPEYRKKFVGTIAAQVRKFPRRYAYYFASEGPGEVKNDEHYIDLYMAYREAVKSVYPDALVYEAGEANISPLNGTARYDQILSRMEGRTVTDFAAGHTYDKDIRQIYGNFRTFVDMLNQHKGYEKCRIALPEGMHFYPYNIPAWNFEQICWNGEGWKGTAPSYDLGWSEKISAAYYARCWLIYLMEFDRVWCATSSARNVGNFRMDYTLAPRAFQKIPNTLGVILGNPKKFLGNFTFAPDTRCLVWEDAKGRPVAAVWNEDPAVDGGFKDAPTARMAYPGAEYIDLMGVSRRPARDGEFPVSPFPLFIRGKASDSAAFTKAIANAVLADADKLPCRMSFSLQPPDTVKLTLINPLARELAATLEVFGKKYEMKIAKDSETSLPIQLPEPVRKGKSEVIRIPYVFKMAGLTVRKEFVLNCFLVPKFDGSWDSIPAIPLTNYKRGRIPEKKDFSVSYQLAWTPKNLRLRVKVTDDIFAPGTKPGYRWQNDILQVYFDTQCSAMKTGKTAYDCDDYEYGFMPTADGKSCEVWRELSPDIQLTLGIAAPKNKTIAKEIPAKFTRTADGYVYDIEFPADYILPIRLTNGSHFAFGIFAADRDRGKGPEKFVANTTEPHAGCRNKPHLWPVAVLTE